MTLKVVLMSLLTGAEKSFGSIGRFNENLGLITIKQGLEDAGFYNIMPIPRKTKDIIPDSELNFDSIEEDIRNCAERGESVIFGLSLTTEDYFKLVPISRIIRKYFPDAVIVGGGPHFVTDNFERIPDSIEIPLSRRILDAVVVGRAKPVIDLVVKHKGDIEDMTGNGFYRLNDKEEVIGKGFGKDPQISNIPFYVYDEENNTRTRYKEKTLVLAINESCRNNCDYCCIKKDTTKIDVDRVTSTLRTCLDDKTKRLHLLDSNPLRSETICSYSKIFQYIDSKNPSVSKMIFLDPSLIANDFKKILHFIYYYKICYVFLGRECATEEDTNIIGSKYENIIKTQKMLDKEKIAIKRLIEMFKKLSSRTKDSTVRDIRISYIVHPFMKKENAVAMRDEILYFMNFSNNNTRITPILMSLMPYPGTRVRTKYYDQIIKPDNFSTYAFINRWDYSLGKGVFLCDAIDIIRHIMKNNKIEKTNGFLVNSFSKAIEAVYSGKMKPMDKLNYDEKKPWGELEKADFYKELIKEL